MGLREALQTYGTQLTTEEAQEKLGRREINLFAYYELSSSWGEFNKLVMQTRNGQNDPILEPLSENTLTTLLEMQRRDLLTTLEFYQVNLNHLSSWLATAREEVEQAARVIQSAHHAATGRLML